MKSITRLSLALMMFALLSVSYLVTTVSAQQDHNKPGMKKNEWGVKPQTHLGTAPGVTYNNLPGLGYNTNQGNQPHTPDNSNEQGASGSSYHLNQPVNQGGIKGVDPRLHPGMNASTTFDDVVSGATPADISHCANMTPTTRPACEAAAHGETPENHVPIGISHCANLEATAARPACEAAAHNVKP